MNYNVSEFIERVLNKIKCKEIHKYIFDEIDDHIEMLKRNYVEAGLDENSAYEKAIAHMGDAEEIGNKLNKTHKYHTDWCSIVLIILILSTSVFIINMVMSISIVNEIYGKYAFILNRIKHIAVSVIVFLTVYFADYRKLKKYSLILYISACILLCLNFVFGRTLSGIRYFRILNVETKSFIFTVLIISYIGLIFRFSKDNFKKILPFSIISSIPILLSLKMGLDYYIISLIFVSTICFTYYIIIDKNIVYRFRKILTVCIIPCILMFLFIIYNSKYSVNFITDYGHETVDSSYILDSLKSIAVNSKFIGKSDISYSIFKSPSAGSDYMFSFIISNMGWLFGIILIAVELSLIFKMFQMSFRIKDEYGKLLALSLATQFLIKFTIHLASNIGISPVLINSYIPFMSYGGTSLICDMAAVGIILGINRKKDIILVHEV